LSFVKRGDRGLLTEITCLERLVTLGYREIFKPALSDRGVDLVVRTATGYHGVQVKTATPKKTRGGRLSWTLDLAAGVARRGTLRHSDPVAYYRQAGVSVMVARVEAGFYVLQLADCGSVNTSLESRSYLWEAWERALGGPPELSDEAEVQSLERQMRLLS